MVYACNKINSDDTNEHRWFLSVYFCYLEQEHKALTDDTDEHRWILAVAFCEIREQLIIS